MKYHTPVLLNEVIAHLKVEKGKKYIDATLGDGGYAIEILKRGGVVLGIDVNLQSINRAKKRIQEKKLEKNITYSQSNFKNIDDIAKKHGFNKVSGIIYDLGYSSSQLEDPELGISFQQNHPLDMRFDKSLGVTAKDLVNALSEKELGGLIYRLSDEKYSKKFAKSIIRHRNLKKIQTTKELSDILVNESPPDYEKGRIHPATRTFQALRIAVNDEITNLEETLPRAAQLLLPGGLIFVISFHSLEDTMTKNFGRDAQPNIRPLVKKPIVPSREEIDANVRARSAKLRVFKKAK